MHNFNLQRIRSTFLTIRTDLPLLEKDKKFFEQGSSVEADALRDDTAVSFS